MSLSLGTMTIDMQKGLFYNAETMAEVTLYYKSANHQADSTLWRCGNEACQSQVYAEAVKPYLGGERRVYLFPGSEPTKFRVTDRRIGHASVIMLPAKDEIRENPSAILVEFGNAQVFIE